MKMASKSGSDFEAILFYINSASYLFFLKSRTV